MSRKSPGRGGSVPLRDSASRRVRWSAYSKLGVLQRGRNMKNFTGVATLCGRWIARRTVPIEALLEIPCAVAKTNTGGVVLLEVGRADRDAGRCVSTWGLVWGGWLGTGPFAQYPQQRTRIPWARSRRTMEPPGWWWVPGLFELN